MAELVKRCLMVFANNRVFTMKNHYLILFIFCSLSCGAAHIGEEKVMGEDLDTIDIQEVQVSRDSVDENKDEGVLIEPQISKEKVQDEVLQRFLAFILRRTIGDNLASSRDAIVLNLINAGDTDILGGVVEAIPFDKDGNPLNGTTDGKNEMLTLNFQVRIPPGALKRVDWPNPEVPFDATCIVMERARIIRPDSVYTYEGSILDDLFMVANDCTPETQALK